MTTAERHLYRTRRFPLGPVLLGTWVLMVVFVLYHNERFLIEPASPMWKEFEPVKWRLLVHGMAGTIALLIGPFQLSSRFRQRHLQAHRLMGRCYAVSVAVAAPLAIWISSVVDTPILHAAAYVQGLGWMIATAIAVLCVRNGNMRQHREWMIRSYAIALIFLEARVITAIPSIERSGLDGIAIVVWLCNAAAWIVPSVIFNWREMFTTNSAKARP
jgi:uncharacterized membrane protein